ncbi:HAD family phosphatase [Lentisphaera profundi]|uniref:HAD family phosphatase n=1 Tax=Lentisphaera profundi TaxID=1658616 RepID=A0ABY7VUT7_9BACT|nr:HAD family phosphatase [Lentisphaera profundi]WDE97983.1 HAD family phosphatase [Lentisphaera profundi]
MLQAIVFDMDGVLLDTERICCEVLLKTFEQHHQEMSRQEFIELIGLNGKEVRLRLQQKLNPATDIDSFIKVWKDEYHLRTVDNAAPIKAGVVALLESFRVQEIPVAVATSTDKVRAEKKLQKTALRKYFQVLVGGDQVSKSKPAPDIYLEAARQLGVEAKDCLAFEDSRYGVRSAYSAGMKVIHIPDMVELGKEEEVMCESIVKDLNEYRIHYCGGESLA